MELMLARNYFSNFKTNLSLKFKCGIPSLDTFRGRYWRPLSGVFDSGRYWFPLIWSLSTQTILQDTWPILLRICCKNHIDPHLHIAFTALASVSTSILLSSSESWETIKNFFSVILLNTCCWTSTLPRDSSKHAAVFSYLLLLV